MSDVQQPTGHCHHGSHCVFRVPIFHHLDDDQVEEVSKVIKTRSFEKGEMLFRPDQNDEKLYVVNEGQVKVYRLSDHGKEQLIRILLPGDFAGELSLVREGKHENYAETMTKSVICSISKQDFEGLMSRFPSIALNVLHEFARRLNEVEKQVTNNVVERIEKRLATFLLEQCPSQKSVFVLPMNKRHIASYLGTSPETLSRTLQKMQNDGLITLIDNKTIRINDKEKLEDI